jgi:hypothetical protein
MYSAVECSILHCPSFCYQQHEGAEVTARDIGCRQPVAAPSSPAAAAAEGAAAAATSGGGGGAGGGGGGGRGGIERLRFAPA